MNDLWQFNFRHLYILYFLLSFLYTNISFILFFSLARSNSFHIPIIFINFLCDIKNFISTYSYLRYILLFCYNFYEICNIGKQYLYGMDFHKIGYRWLTFCEIRYLLWYKRFFILFFLILLITRSVK